jgi:Fe-S oxidoreductase
MTELKVRTMAESLASGEAPEVLFWVGCAGSFDDRAKKITKAIARILQHCNVSFAILGQEEILTVLHLTPYTLHQRVCSIMNVGRVF